MPSNLNRIISVDKNNCEIKIAIPLTSTSGKTRIKQRNVFTEYGIPVATRQIPFAQNHYVEWQIGYDVVTSDTEKAENTTLKSKTFVGANGKQKFLYELSEYIQYFYDWQVITKEELEDVKNFLQSTSSSQLLDAHSDLSIKRTPPIEKTINGCVFNYMRVEYPLLIYGFGDYPIIAEIQVKEKQRAVGTQPMLYFCFPITELDNSEKLLGRTAKPKENGVFTININKKSILLNMLKIFGTLTTSHKQDVISIIDTIMEET